jgi:hypothetical protein
MPDLRSLTRLIVVLSVLAPGCWAPDVMEGQFSCEASDRRCPDGMACDPCRWLCVLPEHACSGAVDAAAGDRFTVDAPAHDLARSDRSLVDRTPDDLSVVDLAMDLALPVDAAAPPDLSAPVDASQPPDLVARPDLACTDPTACTGRCGTLTDRCGNSATCPACPSGFACTGANVCCLSDAALCANAGAHCGTITVTDDCGVTRRPVCGACGGATPVCLNNQCVQCATGADCHDGGTPYCTALHRCGCGFDGVVCSETQMCSTFDGLGMCLIGPGQPCGGGNLCASGTCDSNTFLCFLMQSGQPCRVDTDCLSGACDGIAGCR